MRMGLVADYAAPSHALWEVFGAGKGGGWGQEAAISQDGMARSLPCGGSRSRRGLMAGRPPRRTGGGRAATPRRPSSLASGGGMRGRCGAGARPRLRDDAPVSLGSVRVVVVVVVCVGGQPHLVCACMRVGDGGGWGPG